MKNFVKIVLVLTDKCMLSCEYCEAPKGKRLMSLNVLKKTLRLLSNSFKRRKIFILFFGGEPLLAFPLIKRTIFLCKKWDDFNRYVFTIFTNGVLLDKIDLKFLARNNVEVNISIDGDKETTFTHRKSKNGLINPYNKIKKVLPKLKELGIEIKAEVVVTPYTVNKLFSNFLHLKSLGFEHITIVPVLMLRNNNGFKWELNALKIFKKQLNKISNVVFRDLKFNPLNVYFDNLFIYKIQLKKGLKNICELNEKELTIDLDGGIYIGDSFLILSNSERKKLKLGEIQKLKSSKELEKLYHTYIWNKKNFFSQIYKNPFIVKCKHQPALKILNETMRDLDKKIKSSGIKLSEEID